MSPKGSAEGVSTYQNQIKIIRSKSN